MFKIKHKLIKIGIISTLAVALPLAFAVPAMAASKNTVTESSGVDNNKAKTSSVDGTLSVTSNVITIAPTSSPSKDLTVSSDDDTISVIYNTDSGEILGLMRVHTTPADSNGAKTPENNNNSDNAKMVTVKGTMAVSSNVITITPDETPSKVLAAPADSQVKISYKTDSGEIQGVALKNFSSSKDNNGNNSNTATLKGTLSVSGNTITITLTDTPAKDLTVSSDNTATVTYNIDTGEIQGLTLGANKSPGDHPGFNGMDSGNGRPAGGMDNQGPPATSTTGSN
jgi:hypothetical protein